MCSDCHTATAGRVGKFGDRFAGTVGAVGVLVRLERLRV